LSAEWPVGGSVEAVNPPTAQSACCQPCRSYDVLYCSPAAQNSQTKSTEQKTFMERAEKCVVYIKQEI